MGEKQQMRGSQYGQHPGALRDKSREGDALGEAKLLGEISHLLQHRSLANPRRPEGNAAVAGPSEGANPVERTLHCVGTARVANGKPRRRHGAGCLPLGFRGVEDVLGFGVYIVNDVALRTKRSVGVVAFLAVPKTKGTPPDDVAMVAPHRCRLDPFTQTFQNAEIACRAAHDLVLHAVGMNGESPPLPGGFARRDGAPVAEEPANGELERLGASNQAGENAPGRPPLPDKMVRPGRPAALPALNT